MRSWKRLISMALAGILTVGCVVGCGTAENTAVQPETGSAEASSDGKQPIITVMTNSIGGENQHMMQAGAILQGQELGYTINILAPNAKNNIQAVINNLTKAQTYSDAIVFMPNDNLIELNTEYWDQIAPAIADVKAAGLPVVMMYYKPGDDTLYDTYVGTNNYRAGRALGEAIAENQPNAVVGLLKIDTVSKAQNVCEQGVIEALQENNCTVLADEAIVNWNWETTKSLAATMLENHPEMTTLVCVSDGFAAAAAQMVQEAARVEMTEEEDLATEESAETDEAEVTAEPVQVYTIGASVAGIERVLQGTIQAEVAEQPIQIGRDSIILADQLLKGQPVKKLNRTPYVLVTQDNAQALLDQINAELVLVGLGSDEEE